MKYKLIDNSLNDISNPKETILRNRGIEDWKRYLNLDKSVIHDYHLLKNMDDAVSCLKKHIENNSNIDVIVDSDVDGYTSASMIIRYLRNIDWSLNIRYHLHTRKQHGLSEDIEIPDDCDLLIIPDAGSNDINQCKELSENGTDIIILDHHIMEKENEYAIVVNCQDDTYPNKNLCGAGIVYKFLQAMDEELWENYADDYLDVVALANISDVMDMRELETRYLTDLGLRKIKSKAFKAFIEKQSYSMKDIVNITNVQFYITPSINAMIRMGSQEDKDILFRAFIETDEEFDYKKRGSTEVTKEDVYTRAARLCSNVKARQSKEVQKGVDGIENIINEKGIYNDKVMFINVTDVLGETLTGLVAIKIAEKYNKPCLLLRKQKARDDGFFYGGSCRNFDNSPLDSLKEFLDSTELFEYVQGHDNAAGISIERKFISEAVNKCNEMLKDMDFEEIFPVDFVLDANQMDILFIRSIDEMKDIFATKVKEPLVCIKNVIIPKDELQIMGKEEDSWKIVLDEFAYVKFKVDKENDKVLNATEDLVIDVVGTVTINNYGGILTPQIIIKDYEVK